MEFIKSKDFKNLIIINLGAEINKVCLKFIEDAEEVHDELIEVSRICANITKNINNRRISNKIVKDFKLTLKDLTVELLQTDTLLANILNSNIGEYAKIFFAIYPIFSLLKKYEETPEDEKIVRLLEKFWSWTDNYIFFPDRKYKEFRGMIYEKYGA